MAHAPVNPVWTGCQFRFTSRWQAKSNGTVAICLQFGANRTPLRRFIQGHQRLYNLYSASFPCLFINRCVHCRLPLCFEVTMRIDVFVFLLTKNK